MIRYSFLPQFHTHTSHQEHLAIRDFHYQWLLDANNEPIEGTQTKVQNAKIASTAAVDTRHLKVEVAD